MSVPNEPRKNDFSEMAGGQRTGVFRDFFDFLKQNKKWWLLPVLLMLVLVGVLIILGSTAAAPFIYTLF